MLALKRAFGYDCPIPSVAVIGAGIGGLGALFGPEDPAFTGCVALPDASSASATS